MAGAWRWRKCPRCRRTFEASDFMTLDLGAQWAHKGGARRECPGCHYTAPTAAFGVVQRPAPRAERRPAAQSPEELVDPWWSR